MALHETSIPTLATASQEMVADALPRCVICKSVLVPKRDTGESFCRRCLNTAACVRCGKVVRASTLAGDRHRAGMTCAQDRVEHALYVAGWYRTRTLSFSLKCRGYDVRYIPRWYYPAEENGVMRAPFAPHRQLWSQLDAVVPPSPPIPPNVVEAIEALKQCAAMEVLRGKKRR